MSDVWEQVLGHSDRIEMLQRSASRGRLAHAFLFTGPQGIGKSRVARVLAQCLLCDEMPDELLQACGRCSGCRQFEAESHPDFFLLRPASGKREITIAQIAGEKEKRGQSGLSHDLSMRPMCGSRRIAVIADADMMNDESANALLKTLEEPPSGSVLVLIASDSSAVLPTIRSRCQQVRFAPLERSLVEQILLREGWVSDEQTAGELAELADGSLAVAEELLSADLNSLRNELTAGLSRPRKFSSVTLAAQLVSGLESLSKEPAVVRHYARWMIRFAVAWYRGAVVQIASGSADSPRDVADFRSDLQGSPAAQIELLLELIDRSLQAERELENSMPIPLCFESWLESIRQSSRSLPTV